MKVADIKSQNDVFRKGLQPLIVMDIILISIMLLFRIPSTIISFIEIFDLMVCILLLIEWSVSFYISASKKNFLKQKGTWLDLIASIPFDVILPIFIPQVNLLRYFRLLKILRIIVLFNSFINALENFIEKTRIDKVLAGIFITIGIFTLIMWQWSNLCLLDSLYFVLETITTVGYGDIAPHTLNEKIITMVLIFVGVFIFSTITGVISSYFTDRLINDEEIEHDVKIVKKDLVNMQTQNEELKRIWKI